MRRRSNRLPTPGHLKSSRSPDGSSHQGTERNQLDGLLPGDCSATGATLGERRSYRLVLLLGILPRSGTNYLHSLLAQHPATFGTGRIKENHLLSHADDLERYVEAVGAHWDLPLWGGSILEKKKHQDALWKAVGHGLELFLWLESRYGPKSPSSCRSVMIARTPLAVNLGTVPKLFPNSRVLILLRDPRDLAESFVKSFGGNYREIARKWRIAAGEVDTFLKEDRWAREHALLVRYEDLLLHLEQEIRRILTFLELDAVDYDFCAARRTPVLGSSTFRGKAQELHWRPLPVTPLFRPLERSRDWPEERLREFESVVGGLLRSFGYLPRHSKVKNASKS